MRYGLYISPAGPCGDPRTMAELAALAEASGWDGILLEDYVAHPLVGPTYDPWVCLAAMALRTERVLLGTCVTPLPRRRPQVVASQAAALDRLSGGRAVLGVGAGDPTSSDFAGYAEETDARRRAAMLDEALHVITALWSGEPVSHDGDFYRLRDVRLGARPVQQPRIPIWVGGQYTRRRPRERAARFDGSCLYRIEPPEWEDLTPADIRELRELVDRVQGADAPYEIVVGGRQRREDVETERFYVQSIAAAGATWWSEWISPETDLETLRGRIHAGPLRGAG